IVNHNRQGRKIALVENGSWAATSGKLMREELSKLKNTQFIAENISIRSAVKEEQLAALEALADAIAADIKG
ncbi:MAG: FprA family A-type flavoprotein, partial [Oscillospiraceae bacterium]|nr:FprA family A-type flavoprotein [Oscillospiraceae bacterium]